MVTSAVAVALAVTPRQEDRILAVCSELYVCCHASMHACMRAGDGIAEADGGKVQAGTGDRGE